MGVALGFHAVKFEFANLCLVSLDYIFALFFYPMAAIICPSFLLHICTFFYIAKISLQESIESEMSQSLSTGSSSAAMVRNQVAARKHKHVVTAVKIQWRALLLAVVAIVTVVFYWVSYSCPIQKER